MNDEPTPEEVLAEETARLDKLELQYSRQLLEIQNELHAIQKQRERAEKEYKKSKALEKGETLIYPSDFEDLKPFMDLVKCFSSKQ